MSEHWVSTPLPTDHPLMQAWTAYKATDEYANTRQWAKYTEHVDGSLWAAFMAGWQASNPSEPAQDEALKVYAARYRVVRGDGADANNAPLRDYCFDADASLLYGHDLDAACDAALAQIDALEKPPEAQVASGSLSESGVEAGTQCAAQAQTCSRKGPTGLVCGLKPPCPDCGLALHDVPDGS